MDVDKAFLSLEKEKPILAFPEDGGDKWDPLLMDVQHSVASRPGIANGFSIPSHVLKTMAW